MALSATVTKNAVDLQSDGRYAISFTLVLTEDTTTVFTKSYTTRYRVGDNMTAKINAVIADMNKDIADYKSEKNVLASTALNNAVTAIQSGLVL